MQNTKHVFLNRLYQEHFSELKAFIQKHWSKEQQDAEDLAQEAFLRFAEYPQLESVQNPRAFLFQTLSNLAVDQYRKTQTRRQYLETEIELETINTFHVISPESEVEQQHILQQFTARLNQLPALQRHAFILYRLEGLSHAEIAKRLGISQRSSERYVMLVAQHLLAIEHD